MGEKKSISSFHDVKAHISYACIYNGSSYSQCGRGKEKGSDTKRKIRLTSLMTADITGDRCKPAKKMKQFVTHSVFNTQKFG